MSSSNDDAPEVLPPPVEEEEEQVEEDEDELTHEQLTALTTGLSARDLRLQLRLYKFDPARGRASLRTLVQDFWKSLKNGTEAASDIMVEKKQIWTEIVKRATKEFENMVLAYSTDPYSAIVVKIYLKSGTLTAKTVQYEKIPSPALSINEQITKNEITLASTLDIAFLKRFEHALANDERPKAKEQIGLFWSHITNELLRRANGRFQTPTKISVGGEPFEEYMLRSRHQQVLNYKATEHNTVVILFDSAEHKFVNVAVRDNEVSGEADLTTIYDTKVLPRQVRVFDLRPQYARYRGFLPALLTWSPDVVEQKPHAKRPRRRASAAPTPSEAPPPPPPPPPVAVAPVADIPAVEEPKGLFERNTHPKSADLLEYVRTKLPLVGAARRTDLETLRLSLLAYQAAFDGAPIDSFLEKTSGVEVDDEDNDDGANEALKPYSVYMAVVKPKLLAFQIDVGATLARTQQNVDKLDQFLSAAVDATKMDENNAKPVRDVNGASKFTQDLEFPNLARFLSLYHTTPFGALDTHADRLRALLKSFATGRFSAREANLFNGPELAQRFFNAQRASELFSTVVEQMTLDYVDRDVLRVVPPGMSESMFSADIAVVRAYAIRNPVDKCIPVYLLETFAIVGQRSQVTNENTRLDVALRVQSPAKIVEVCYNAARGLYVQPQPYAGRDRVFTFDPLTSASIRPKRDANAMAVDAKYRNKKQNDFSAATKRIK